MNRMHDIMNGVLRVADEVLYKWKAEMIQMNDFTKGGLK